MFSFVISIGSVLAGPIQIDEEDEVTRMLAAESIRKAELLARQQEAKVCKFTALQSNWNFSSKRVRQQAAIEENLVFSSLIMT